MANKAKKMRESDWLARLVLTSSEAEMLGGQIYDIQGYSELVDHLEEPRKSFHCHLSPECTHLVDPLAVLHVVPPEHETDQRDAG